MQHTCFECHKSFLAKNKPSNPDKPFCSRSCSATHNNKHVHKRKLEGTCKFCSMSCSKARSYCSIECYDTSRKSRAPRPKRVTPAQSVVSHYRLKKLKAIEYKGGKCKICDYSKSVRALHFHHLDPLQKDFTISGRTISWERMKTELDKCVLLCSNCHSEVHDGVTSLPL